MSGDFSYPLFAQLGYVGGTALGASLSPTHVVQVASPGAQSFIFEASIYSGAGNPVAGNATSSALFVPFGPGGAQGAGIASAGDNGWELPQR